VPIEARIRALRLVIVLIAAGFPLLFVGTASAATDYVVNSDRNYFVRAIDWLETGSGTRVLILTYPGSWQPHVREGCTANYYVLKVTPGLETMALRPVAENYCGHRLDESGRLLANGDVMLLIEGRVETWRPGQGRIGGWAISDVEALQRHHPSATKSFRVLDANAGGTIVYAGDLPRGRGDTETPSAIIAGLSKDGGVRWDHVFAEPGVVLSSMDIWATADGGALLHARAGPMRGRGYPEGVAPTGMTGAENRLYRFSSTGEIAAPIVIASYNPPTGPVELPDMQTDPEGYRAALKSVIDSGSVETYTDGQLVGNARSDGSVDVLLGRGTRELRVIRVNAGGKVDFEETLTDPMNSKQRPPWQDGYVTGNAVTLFGALGLKATRLPQGYATRFDLNSRELTTRLAPLDGPGLDMAIHARDEERQNLEHDPGQQPQILARLAGKPLMISSIKRNRKEALQLTEVDTNLQTYAGMRPKKKEPQRRSPPQAETPPAPLAPAPKITGGDCDCSCEYLATMQEEGRELAAWAKAAGQPVPTEPIMRISQCLVSCQQQVMACARQR
jgi:hypothetical protein